MWAGKYKERGRSFAAAGTGQARSTILAIAAAAGGTIADADLDASTPTPAGAAGAVALSAGLRAELHHQLAKLNVAPVFEVGDNVARIESVEGGRYGGIKERLRNRPDQAVEIAAEFYGANRQTFEEVAAIAADQQGQFVGAMTPE